MRRRPARYPASKVRVCEHCGECYEAQRVGTGAVRLRPSARERRYVSDPRPRRDYRYEDAHDCPGRALARAERERSNREMMRRLQGMLGRVLRG